VDTPVLRRRAEALDGPVDRDAEQRPDQQAGESDSDDDHHDGSSELTIGAWSDRGRMIILPLLSDPAVGAGSWRACALKMT
jgi:hypothetical protein